MIRFDVIETAPHRPPGGAARRERCLSCTPKPENLLASVQLGECAVERALDSPLLGVPPQGVAMDAENTACLTDGQLVARLDSRS